MDAYARALHATEVFLKLNAEYERLRSIYPFLMRSFSLKLDSRLTGKDDPWDIKGLSEFTYCYRKQRALNSLTANDGIATWLTDIMFHASLFDLSDKHLITGEQWQEIEQHIRANKLTGYKKVMLNYCQKIEEKIVCRSS
jgi:hypothetical protein